jgi:hypothetical protein
MATRRLTNQDLVLLQNKRIIRATIDLRMAAYRDAVLNRLICDMEEIFFTLQAQGVEFALDESPGKEMTKAINEAINDISATFVVEGQ